MTDTKDLLRLLFRRDDIVAHISDGPIDIRSLTAAVDVSRPTVHRSLKSLQEHDVVTETPDGYRLTTYGQLVFDRYRSTLSEFETVHQNKSLLLALRDSAEISSDMLEGASYTRSLPFAPERPLGVIESVVREATTVRGFSPVIVGRYVSLFHDQLMTTTLDAEILTTPAVFEYLVSNWPDQLEETIDAGLSCLVVDDSLPFGLIVVDEPVERVCVIVYDDGTLRGVIQNDSPAAVQWARDFYESYRERATQPSINE
ncbi:Predicted transcriptional regulator, contains HTH domain [Halogranum gelatinilyticum]|uniref:Predicted transcriptional regulator, contains HTH domain n=1 Tax=Halogranum gelatinilyticum TaxID=660521 RepID=A0A1G9XH25_9EURY|nr:Predicted transcriptional regulator, contains HTH domain [Halogranum gelatinilyticum]